MKQYLLFIFLICFVSPVIAQTCKPPTEMRTISMAKLRWMHTDYKIYHEPSEKEKIIYDNCSAFIKCVQTSGRYQNYYCFDTNIRQELLDYEELRHTYKGTFKNGFYHKGEQKWMDKNIVMDSYKGEFYRSMMHGKGVFNFLNGSSFEGLYRSNKPTEGILKERNGNVFEGRVTRFYNFIDGELKLTNGDVYAGEFGSQDKKQGFGIYDFKNGDSYNGYFKNDLYHGEGTYFLNSQRASYEGNWLKGKPSGLFEIFYIDKLKDKSGKIKTKYEGTINVKLQLNGNGKLIYSDGSFLEGKFRNDKKIGIFKLTDNAKIMFQYFNNGKFDKFETEYFLGKRYIDGTEILQNYTKAIEHFYRASAGNNKKAMLEISKLFYEGKIKVKLTSFQKILNYFDDGNTLKKLNKVKAHMWANLAGNMQYRDNIKLDADELMEAQKLAKICLDKNYIGC